MSLNNLQIFLWETQFTFNPRDKLRTLTLFLQGPFVNFWLKIWKKTSLNFLNHNLIFFQNINFNSLLDQICIVKYHPLKFCKQFLRKQSSVSIRKTNTEQKHVFFNDRLLLVNFRADNFLINLLFWNFNFNRVQDEISTVKYHPLKFCKQFPRKQNLVSIRKTNTEQKHVFFNDRLRLVNFRGDNFLIHSTITNKLQLSTYTSLNTLLHSNLERLCSKTF
jgi:hypothetical protein